MNKFSELTAFVERVVDSLPPEEFVKATSNAGAVSEECLTILTTLNKSAYQTSYDEPGIQTVSEIADANTILSELGGLMMRVQAKRDSIQTVS